MEEERRRAPRFPFIAAREVLDENSGSLLSIRVSDLSLNGCYLDTINPFPDGTLVHVKIFTDSNRFEAPATVVYFHTHLGMGVAFRELDSTHLTVLQNWLPSDAEASYQAEG